MPLWGPYMAMLESKVADINNAGTDGFAGSITAALFLSRFVAPEVRWLHADIYGWTPAAKPARPRRRRGAGDPRALRSLIGTRYGA